MSALKPKTQESVLHLPDLGCKATNERVSRMRKAEGGGQKLDEMALRSILDGKDIAPKQPEPVKQPEAPSAPTPGAAPEPPGAEISQPPILFVPCDILASSLLWLWICYAIERRFAGVRYKSLSPAKVRPQSRL